MAQKFPFETNADKYSRQLWSKQAYLYLAEFFRKAVFDTNVQVIEGGTIDDYRFSGPAEDWRLPGGGGGTSAYSSYFKVIDASTTDVCKIGVKDGGWLDPYNDPSICGTVKVNKFVVNVPQYLSDSIQSAGFFYVWLVSWISESDGAGSTIVVGDQTRPTETDISAPEVISYGSQLLGRVYVELVEGKARIMGITQDYLRGGEAVELLWGVCGDDVEVEL